MKVTVITYCNSCHDDILETVESIAFQNYKKIESVVIATDSNTLSTIKASANHSNKYKFVRSSGINFFGDLRDGIEVAEGDIICILNPGCVFNDEKVVGDIVNFFTGANIDIAYGDYISITNGIRKYEVLGIYNPGSFMDGWHPSLSGTFFKNSVLKKNINIISSNKWACDYEILFNIFELAKHRILYVPRPLIICKAGSGIRSIKIKIFRFFEILLIVKRSAICNLSQYLKFVLSIFKNPYL